MDITELLALSIKNNASDLHLSAELPPLFRVDGDLHPLDAPALDKKSVSDLLHDILTDKQRKALEENLEVDFSVDIPNLSRFRVNIFHQLRGLAGAFRVIPNQIATLEELGMPNILKDLALLPRGLVLITGATGSGKSTTLAAVIDYINQIKNNHILTIEDPIEFVHTSKKCLVNQREVHRDTRSFASALRSALREDPDIILVGEMRDIETIRLALTAAETGHLVFATLHTNSATKTINRIIDVFPAEEKSMVRTMLSESLQGVVAQTLLKRFKSGRVAAIEIMICTHAIRNLIREDKIAQMYSTIQTGQVYGMHTLDQHLQELVEDRTIASKTAREIAVNKTLFKE